MSKELIKNLFQLRALPRIPFLPWVCSFAAQLEQIEVRAMLSDAGLLSRALLNAQKLFGYDLIISVFDPSLEAEACGCKVDWNDDKTSARVVSHPLGEAAEIENLDISNFEKQGRLPVVLEATKRMRIIKGKEVAIAGVITGPLTLAKQLRGEAFIDELNEGLEVASKIVELAGKVGLKLCRSYCELGVDVIVIAEEMLGRLHSDTYQIVAPSLQSIWNVARYYNVYSLILSRGCDSSHIEPIFKLGADGAALAGNIEHTKVKEAALKQNRCYSCNIPDPISPETSFQVINSLKQSLSVKESGFFLSTEWEVPYTTSVVGMHGIIRAIQGATNF